MPLFSIIIPVYNVQNYLAACIKSVAEQEGPRDWECLLVDDGSTDMTPQLCDAFAAEIPGVRALHRKNGGPSAARNAGIRAATGEWLLFLDGDDAMAPGLLAALRRELAAHPGYDWFIGRHLEWQADGSLTEHTGQRLLPGPFDSTDYGERLHALYTAAHWAVWKYCLRRSFLLGTGVRFRRDVSWAEDCLFILTLLNECECLYFLDLVFTHYRVGRQGSLLTDPHNLPRRFSSLAAAQRHLAALQATGRVTPEVYRCMEDAFADVFWPQARTAAVRDAKVRRRCLPCLKSLRPLYARGIQVRTRRDWRLFQTLMRLCGPRLALWAAACLKKG